MHRRNFESIHVAKRSRIGWKYLEKRKNGGGINLRTPRFHGGIRKSPPRGPRSSPQAVLERGKEIRVKG
jgi:hypothetical protein